MDDFLYILKMQLMERMPPQQVEEQIRLYEDYIQEQIAGGKTLEQVMRKLGDPMEVAKLVIDDYEKRAGERERQKQMSAEEINAKIRNPERGIRAEFKENEGWDVRLGKLKLNSWYGTLLILGIVLVIFILFSELRR